MDPVDILLKQYATPYHAKTFPALKAYDKNPNKKLNGYTNWEFCATEMIRNGEPHVSYNLRKNYHLIPNRF